MNFLPLRGGRVLGAILNRSESRCVKPNGQHLVHCSPEEAELSLGALRKRIEMQLPPTIGVKLELDRVARRERDGRRITLPAR